MPPISPLNGSLATPRAQPLYAILSMTEHPPTVEMSLEVLSIAVRKAADDLRDVGVVLERARADIAAHNTSVSRDILKNAEHAVTHLRHADEALKSVLQDLAERD
jgi:hypothetical protein